jgi:hypothetical protein
MLQRQVALQIHVATTEFFQNQILHNCWSSGLLIGVAALRVQWLRPLKPTESNPDSL